MKLVFNKNNKELLKPTREQFLVYMASEILKIDKNKYKIYDGRYYNYNSYGISIKCLSNDSNYNNIAIRYNNRTVLANKFNKRSFKSDNYYTRLYGNIVKYKPGLWEDALTKLYNKMIEQKVEIFNIENDLLSVKMEKPNDISINFKQMAKDILLSLGERYPVKSLYNASYDYYYKYEDNGLFLCSKEDSNLDNINMLFNNIPIDNNNFDGKDALKELHDELPIKLARKKIAQQNNIYCVDLYKKILFLLKNNIINENKGEFERVFYDLKYNNKELESQKIKVLISDEDVLHIKESMLFHNYTALEYSPGLWEQKINKLYNNYYEMGLQNTEENTKANEKVKEYVKQFHDIK